MARPDKEATVALLAEELADAGGIYLADFTGLTVDAVDQLRREFRAQGVKYRVVKNTLMRRAVERADRAKLMPYLKGPTSIAIAGEDNLEPARVFNRFIKDHELPKLKAGLVEGRLVEGREIHRLALLPARDVLYAQLLGLLNSPLSGVMGVLTGLMSKVAGVLTEIEKKKKAEQESAA